MAHFQFLIRVFADLYTAKSTSVVSITSCIGYFADYKMLLNHKVNVLLVSCILLSNFDITMCWFRYIYKITASVFWRWALKATRLLVLFAKSPKRFGLIYCSVFILFCGFICDKCLSIELPVTEENVRSIKYLLNTTTWLTKGAFYST